MGVVAGAKRPVADHQIETLERTAARPASLVGAVVAQRGARTFDLSVTGLYWGTFRLLESLVTSNRHMGFAERELKQGKWIP